MTKFIEQHWPIIIANPLTFVLFGIIVFVIGFTFAKIFLDGALSACKERLAGAKDEIEKLKADENLLLKKLEQHGDDINEIKAELASQPKIIVSADQPALESAKEGDIWLNP